MTIATKRILYLFFILVFFVISPLLFLNSSGYRINFKKLTLQKTGTLVISTVPAGARIRLNDTILKPATPARLRFLLPDEYTLTLQHDYYFDWTSHIKIASNLVTFIENIRLIKQPALLSVAAGHITWAQTLDHDAIAYTVDTAAEKTLMFYRPGDATSTLLYRLPANAQIQKISDSPSGKKILLAVTTSKTLEFFVLDALQKNMTSISNGTKQYFEKMRWHESDENILLGLRLNVLNRIHLDRLTYEPILSSRIEDFTAFDDNIYAVTREGSKYYLERFTSGSTEAPKKIKLPNSGEYHITGLTRQLLSIVDLKTQSAFLINPEVFNTLNQAALENQTLFSDNGNDFSLNLTGTNLLIHHDFELTYFNLKENKKKLITRISTPIHGSAWVLGDSHIAYQVNDELMFVDLPDETHPEINFNRIISFDELSGFLVSGKNHEQVYLFGQTQGSRGLYLLDFHD